VNPGNAFALVALAIGAMGIYVADADDAPGAAVIGLLLMLGAVVLGVKPRGTGCRPGPPAPRWPSAPSLRRSPHF